MENLSHHELKILNLVKEYPEILTDLEKRREVAEKAGLSEKSIRNRIGELKKHGYLKMEEKKDKSEDRFVNDRFPSLMFISNIWDNKFRIVRNAVLAALVMVAVSLILPKTYRASSIILISKEDKSLFSSGLIPMLAPVGLIGDLGENESMTYLAILKSRTVMEDAVKEFNLIERYHSSNTEKAIEELRNNTSFEINEENALEISVFTRTGWLHPDDEEIVARELSANIANYFSSRLDEVNKKLKTEKARFHRQFIEKRYLESIRELNKAELALKQFQESTNMVNLPEQTGALIEVAAMLQGEIYMKEIEKSVLRDTYSQTHPLYTSKVKEIDVLKNQLDSLNSGLREDEIFPSISRLPDLGYQYVSHIREREIQNSIYQLITNEYENAKIQESKNTPTLQVLDRATVPQLKYKPQRGKLVLLGFMIVLFLSTYYYYFKDRYNYSGN